MDPFKVHILGCGSALPTLRHNASSQVVEVRQKLLMLDCSEGTQMQLRKSHLRFTKLGHVFITHLHGDHCFGLIGMISTFGLLGRTAKLHIHAPEALGPELDRQIQFLTHDLGFEVVFYPVDTTQRQIVYEDRSITVESIPLEHRVPCCGYLIKEKPTRRPDDHLRSYAYISDTRYMPHLHEEIMGIDTLYHESTYGDDHIPQSEKYFHSTARQAAMVAAEAKVGKLLLGHYSSRYEDENLLLSQAKEVFENTFLSNEMAVFDV